MAELNIPHPEIYPPYTQMHEWANERAEECHQNERDKIYRAITEHSNIIK